MVLRVTFTSDEIDNCNIFRANTIHIQLKVEKKGVLGKIEDDEGDCQEGGAKQVPHCCEIWYRSVVRIRSPAPHPVDEDLTEIKQHCNLDKNISKNVEHYSNMIIEWSV